MSFLLTTDFDSVLEQFKYKEKTCHINMAFDNILNLWDMLDDDFMSDYEKPFIAIAILVMESDGLEFKDYEECLELFKFLVREFLNINTGNSEEESNEESNENDRESKRKKFDYKKDAELIFASFYKEYRIDLFEMQGKLHWKKFTALLFNLSDETAFKKVIGYREMKMPTTKEYKKEYVDYVMKMKEIYSLDERTDKEKLNEAFNKVAGFFRK